jgi:glycosyltransferase involved in cell wall biosynthesis
MRVVLLPGIWPPDVGGPASHGPELARYLVGRGHPVRVVTMASSAPTERPCPVETVSRARPFPVRYGLLTVRAARAARRADVLYASATYAAAAAASALSRRPLVAKLVSDPAYERARRYGLFGGTLEEFQAAGGLLLSALKRARSLALGRARVVVVPSEYLASMARGWGFREGIVMVVPNAAPVLAGEAEAPGPREGLVFAGRLTRQKALHILLQALVGLPEARLVVIGDGPDRRRLEQLAVDLGVDGRVAFPGALPRADVLRALARAQAAVLSSDWENFPHMAVEALAVGTPLVATAVGGVPEIVRDGVNGLLVPPGRPEELSQALARLLGSPELQARLSSAARASVEAFEPDRIYGRLEAAVASACRA